MPTKTLPASAQPKPKSWFDAPVQALAPLLTLDEAHALLQALARTGQTFLGADEEDEPRWVRDPA
jgi:hypothetical protein